MTHLRKTMLEELERRNYSQSTSRAYVHRVFDFRRYFKRAPDQFRFRAHSRISGLSFRERKLDASTVNAATAALRFFFVGTLKKNWSITETPYPRREFRLPEVLSQEQVAKLIDAATTPFYRVLLMSAYATGVRRGELALLKIVDMDIDRMGIHVKGGKGRKDRDVMLSPKLLVELQHHLDRLPRRPETWLFPGNRWYTGRNPISPKVTWTACQRRLNEPDSVMRFIPTRCGTASPRICWKQERICVPFRFCLVIGSWKKQPSTCTFRAAT